jgi:hypothetical protein
MEFYNVTKDSYHNFYAIAPMSLANNGRYLVLQPDEHSANYVRSVMAYSLVNPLTRPDLFQFVAYAGYMPLFLPLF